jgi:nitrite reductase/ring-hydroxylating ferredoxin subunit
MKPLSTVEVEPGEMKQGKVGDKRVLIANLNGTFYAIGDVCMHMGCSLSNGTLNGDNVICPCHGSTYNVKTGSVVRGPTTRPEPAFEVKADGGRIYLKV